MIYLLAGLNTCGDVIYTHQLKRSEDYRGVGGYKMYHNEYMAVVYLYILPRGTNWAILNFNYSSYRVEGCYHRPSDLPPLEETIPFGPLYLGNGQWEQTEKRDAHVPCARCGVML